MSKSALEIGKAFLEKNATSPGVTTTPSGLQYEILREGSGSSPTLKDTVVVNYRGKLLNGVEFDSSYLAGREPAEFPLKRVRIFVSSFRLNWPTANAAPAST